MSITSPVTIPDGVALLLPFVVAMLSSALKQDRLPDVVNALIAFCAIVITSLLCLFLVGGFSGAPVIVVGGLLAYVVYFLQHDYNVLLTWLLSLGSQHVITNGGIGGGQPTNSTPGSSPTQPPVSPS
jgi:hypothetical protein